MFQYTRMMIYLDKDKQTSLSSLEAKYDMHVRPKVKHVHIVCVELIREIHYTIISPTKIAMENVLWSRGKYAYGYGIN